MLKTRVITAIVLLAVILPVLFYGPIWSVNLVCMVFFSAACWEGLRLFNYRLVNFAVVVWTVLFIWLAFTGNPSQYMLIWVVGCLAWIGLFIPRLKIGLPQNGDTSRFANVVYLNLYLISILACFLAILVFLQRSPIYLLSVMALVWVADIGAYFFGRAFGKRKLAPTISPGKSWEGALGGWLCVLLFGAACTQIVRFDNFSAAIQHHWGWSGLFLVLSLVTVASVVGDLVESQLKRRAQVKDSSNLLPGHGGVLDRIDALISVLPLAIMIEVTMKITNNS